MKKGALEVYKPSLFDFKVSIEEQPCESEIGFSGGFMGYRMVGFIVLEDILVRTRIIPVVSISQTRQNKELSERQFKEIACPMA